MQSVGWSKVAAHSFHIDEEEVAIKTTNLRVITTANPTSDNLNQSIHPNAKPNPTPKDKKKNQKIQPTSESTRVLRKEKIGSFFKIILVVIESAKKVKEKSRTPRKKLLIKGKRAKVQRLTPTIHVTAIAMSTFLYDGRVNMEE
jgi:hypothetical protein